MKLSPTLDPVTPRIFSLTDDLAELGSLLTPDDRLAVISDITAKLTRDRVEVDLNTNTASRRGVTVRLTPNYAVFLFKLATAYPRVVTIDEIGVAIWGTARRGKSLNTIRVMATQMRKIIAPLVASIENKHGRGYRLELGAA